MKKNINQYGETPKTPIRADGRKRWTPEEDLKLLEYANGVGLTTAVEKELGRNRAAMYQRLRTLSQYENRYQGRRKLPDELRAKIDLWKKTEHKRGRRPNSLKGI